MSATSARPSCWSGRDHLAGGYCGRGVYHWSGYGGILHFGVKMFVAVRKSRICQTLISLPNKGVRLWLLWLEK